MVTTSVQGSGDLTSRRSGRFIIPTPRSYYSRCPLLLPVPPARSTHLGFCRWKVNPGQRSLFPIEQPNFLKPPAPVSPRPKRQEEPGQATPLHSRTPPGSKRTPRAQAHTPAHTGPSPRRARDQGRPRNGAARRCTASHRTAAAGEHGTVHDATGAARTHGHVVVLGTCSATTWSSIERAGAS